MDGFSTIAQHINRDSGKVMHCPHVNRRHYAKRMCMSCYHRVGRTKKAWACKHTNKLHYSKGLC